MESRERIFSGNVASNYDAFFETGYGRKIFFLEKELMFYCLEPLKFSSLLEVGCGSGIWGEFWKRGKGVKRVVGLDISLDMLKQAKLKGWKELMFGRAEEMPFKDKSFDSVIFITSLEFIKGREKAVNEALRVAKKYVAVGYLNKLSFLAFKRRIRALFRKSIYKSASFFSKREIIQLFKSRAERLNRKIEVVRSGTTLNFVSERFVSLKLEFFSKFSLPFGAFGFIVFEVR